MDRVKRATRRSLPSVGRPFQAAPRRLPSWWFRARPRSGRADPDDRHPTARCRRRERLRSRARNARAAQSTGSSFREWRRRSLPDASGRVSGRVGATASDDTRSSGAPPSSHPPSGEERACRPIRARTSEPDYLASLDRCRTLGSRSERPGVRTDTCRPRPTRRP
jgi:hypothetical protein